MGNNNKPVEKHVLMVEVIAWRYSKGGDIAGLRIAGRWFERAGFAIGQKVLIIARNGRLYLRKMEA